MQAVSPLWATIIILGVFAINSYVATCRAAYKALSEATIKRMEKEEIKNIGVVKRVFIASESYINPFDIYMILLAITMGMVMYFVIHVQLTNWMNTSNLFLFQEFEHQQIARVACKVIVLLVIVFIYMILAILIPSRVGTKHSEWYATKQVGLVRMSFVLICPFTGLLKAVIHIGEKLFRVNPREYEEELTEEEILSVLTEGQEKGVLEAAEAEMISNIFDFSEKEARDIMTPKIRIVGVNAEMSLIEALDFMLGESYSRYPLYEENRDNIIGILYLKDVVEYYVKKKNRKVSLKEIAREPYFVPDTQNISVLFHELRHRKIHMAIAIDEYGQTAGLVAMEDILEEIVGNIQDEYDDEERLITCLDDHTYLVKGYTTLDELKEEIGLDVETEDFDTINGFLISQLSRILNDGETETVEFKDFRFEILEIKNKVIEQVKITKLDNLIIPDETEGLD